MAVKIRSETCNHCNARFLYDSDCGGDWLPSGILQWWCPECGQMKPLIGIGNYLSKNRKRQISNEMAREKKLSFKECKKIAFSIKCSDESEFIKIFNNKIYKKFRVKSC